MACLGDITSYIGKFIYLQLFCRSNVNLVKMFKWTALKFTF